MLIEWITTTLVMGHSDALSRVWVLHWVVRARWPGGPNRPASVAWPGRRRRWTSASWLRGRSRCLTMPMSLASLGRGDGARRGGSPNRIDDADGSCEQRSRR
jgi:hypothetical protein